MDKSDLVGRHPLSNEFLTNIVIYRKDRFLLRQRHRALISAKLRAVSSTSSQDRTGDLEVMIWLMNFCLFSTVCHR